LDTTKKELPLSGPLEGVTVLDLTIALAGPFATLLLAGLGARVIKVENPTAGDQARNNAPYLGATGAKLVREREDDISVSVLNRLRNKLGVTLNLKHPRAGAIFADLVRSSDVVVENFSHGVVDRLGVGYSVAREINPRIVYCSINGFGGDDTAEAQSSGKAMDTIIRPTTRRFVSASPSPISSLPSMGSSEPWRRCARPSSPASDSMWLFPCSVS
jgi:crotonobetainyl-CoA:carnitine CoA-transferase CaiB-like acyl-CoA transferase